MRPSARKKIGLLYAGESSLSASYWRQWLSALPELNIIADVVPIVIDGKRRQDYTLASIMALAETIARHYAAVDGFALLYGLDHILYASAALSFCLTGLNKPVLVTSGVLQPQDGGSGGKTDVGLKANLINAMQAATLPLAEVTIIYGNRLLRGNAAYRVSAADLNAFDAPSNAVLGRIDFSIRLLERNLRSSSRTKLALASLSDRVEYLILTPWLTAPMFKRRIADAKALLVDARQCQDLPRWMRVYLESGECKKPVAVLTASPEVTLSSRRVALLPIGAPEAMLAKLAWATAMAKTPEKITSLMVQDIAGEFTV